MREDKFTICEKIVLIFFIRICFLNVNKQLIHKKQIHLIFHKKKLIQTKTV